MNDDVIKTAFSYDMEAIIEKNFSPTLPVTQSPIRTLRSLRRTNARILLNEVLVSTVSAYKHLRTDKYHR